MAAMTDTKRPRPVVLCVLDGWGYREDPADNAVAQANTPFSIVFGRRDPTLSCMPRKRMSACRTVRSATPKSGT